MPSPKVDSAVVTYQSHVPLIPSKERQEQFLSLLKAAYQHRRKAFPKVLEKECHINSESIEVWLRQHGASPTSRPDELSFAEWVDLFLVL